MSATKTGKRYGRQEPTFSVVGNYDYTFGDDALRFFKRYGVKFTPYQEHELTLYLARSENPHAEFDDYAGSIICISRPRQTGKSYAARFYALWEAMIEGKHVLYTAHNGDTTTEMFKALKTFLENNPDLYKQLKPGNEGIYNAPIRMGFYFQNGGQIELKTRTKSLSRGRSTEIIILDEAQELTDAQLEALAPTDIASEFDSQTIAIGTPPGPECNGTVYKGWRDSAKEGGDAAADIWWLEWSIDYIPQDIFDPDIWYEYNPGMGWRITEKKMKAAATKFKQNIEGFAREYLGYWAPGFSIKAVISSSLWEACEISESEAAAINGLPSYGVKFSPDGTRGSIAVCLKEKDGHTFVELIDSVDMSVGVSYFVEFLEPRWRKAACIVIDGAANAQTLVDMLKADKVPTKIVVKLPTAREYGDACSRFKNAIVEHTISHAGYDDLTDSVTQCKRRNVGTSGAWGFAPITEEIDATPCEAAALAYYGAVTSKRNPLKKQKAGY